MRRLLAAIALLCLLVPAPALSGSLTWMNSGSDSTGDTSLLAGVSTSNGTLTSDATDSHTGPRSIKSDVTTLAGRARFQSPNAIGVVADTGTRTSFWWKMSALPASTTIFSTLYQSNGTTALYNLGVQSSGVLRQPTVNSITGKNGSTTLAINTWYRISISYLITSTSSYTFRVYVNGNLEISTTQADGTMAAVTSAIWAYGNNGGAVTTMRFDDLVIDDGTDLTDMGNVLVTAKKPASLATNTFDTNVGANPANRWTNVNEVPLSATNGWTQAATADTQENYGIEARGAGDVNINGTTIVGRLAWLWAKGAAGSSGAPKLQDSGVDNAIVLTNTAAFYFIITNNGNYPTTIGMRSTNSADDTFLYECGFEIAYRLGGGLLILGVGE